MELGYGLGIGLQVTPKDYVELVKSRQSAQAKAQAAKKAAADKALERTYERFTKEVGGATVLPVNQDMYDSSINDFYRMAEDLSGQDTPNINALNEQFSKTKGVVMNLSAQYKLFEDLSNDAEKFGITPNELQQIRTEKDPEKLNQWITANGTGTFQLNNVNGIPMLVSRPIQYTPIKKTFDEYAADKNLFNDKSAGTEFNEKFGPNTIRYYGINPAAKDAFVYSVTTSPSMYESAAKEYRGAMAGKAKPAIGSPEEKEAVIKFTGDTYEKMAKPLLMNEKYSDRRTIVNVNTVPPKERGDAPTYGLQPRNLYTELTMNAQATWGIGEISFTGGTPKGIRNANTGELIKSAAGKYDSGEIIIAPVATKNMSMSYTFPQTGQVFKFDYAAGDPIPKEFEVEALKQGGITYSKLAMAEYTPSGAKSNPFPVVIPPGTAVNNAYGKLDAKEKPAFDKILKDLNTNLAKFNSLDKAFQNELLEKYKDFDTIFESQEYKGQRQILGKSNTGSDYNDYKAFQKGGGTLSYDDWISKGKPTN